ncbi:MAG: NAD(P)/FAD-dependent oxidoreductase [Pseudomonadales bacterium]|nr:NAD(P)/FAD-dependent oxidoreductase [Pseudomonadales bacterium]
MTEVKKYSIDTSNLDFDPDKVRQQYIQERDKRLREDGFGQYQHASGDFSGFMEDHYVEPGFEREPLNDEVEVVIIGGGFGGLLTGAQLRKAGVEKIRFIEKAGDFGGTWYWNRYPGAQCDVESFVYFPLLEELDYIPKERYSHAPEILDHSIAIAKKYDLYRDTCFQTEVTELRWDEVTNLWTIQTDRKDQIKAHYVVMANGCLTRPKLPGIPGINSFKGHTFHTSRWDYNYTGGSSEGDLTNLADKRVGIIGTGATAVQCIPHLGKDAKELYVFQRTPSSVDIRNNAPTDPEWAENLQPGWHQERVKNFSMTVSGRPPKKAKSNQNQVDDGWTDVANEAEKMAREKPQTTAAEKKELLEIADLKKMQEIRARVSDIVKDEATADQLKAFYWQFCKRPCFHDDYLQTYNLDSVSLVDTEGQGVEQITPAGLVVNGKEYPLDCLIFGTGFELGSSYTTRAGYDVIGRDGIALSDKWADRPSTLHGISSRGFPNCFFLGYIQTGVSPNFTHMLGEQAQHLAYVIKHGRKIGAKTIEPTQQAEDAWVAVIEQTAEAVERHFAKCTPGYYSNEGETGNRNGFMNGQYGGGPEKFFQIIADWREEGSLKGLEIT